MSFPDNKIRTNLSIYSVTFVDAVIPVDDIEFRVAQAPNRRLYQVKAGQVTRGVQKDSATFIKELTWWCRSKTEDVTMVHGLAVQCLCRVQ